MTVTLTTFHVVAIAILVVATNVISFMAGAMDGIENKFNSYYTVIANLVNALRELIDELKGHYTIMENLINTLRELIDTLKDESGND